MTLSVVNGIVSDQISIKDRAFNYGDGVFETIVVHNKKLHYWAEHYDRLKTGCERLSIKAPDEAELLTDIAKLNFDTKSSVIKIVVSRGQGGRGYSVDGIEKPNIVISNNPWPQFVETYQQQGIKARLCQHRLIINPALAGIKHLNRLDQVLARNEWHNDDFQEGLMLDQNDHLLEGISTNLFVKINQQWITPATKNCAVAGVMRAVILSKAAEIGLNIEQRQIHHSELSLVEEMFVSNSVWGIVPVQSCDAYSFVIGKVSQQLKMELEQDKESVLYVI